MLKLLHSPRFSQMLLLPLSGSFVFDILQTRGSQLSVPRRVSVNTKSLWMVNTDCISHPYRDLDCKIWLFGLQKYSKAKTKSTLLRENVLKLCCPQHAERIYAHLQGFKLIQAHSQVLVNPGCCCYLSMSLLLPSVAGSQRIFNKSFLLQIILWLLRNWN